MADLASLQVQLELQTAQFTEQMGKVNKQIDGLNKKVDSTSATFAKLGKQLAAAVSVGLIVNTFKKVIDSMDEMAEAVQKLGISAETLQGLKYAAEQSGVGFDALSSSLKKLSVNMADVEKGTSDAAKALRAIGVRGTDSAAEALNKIADVFKQIPDGAQKTALAVAIFGKAGNELIPMLNEGAAGIQAMTDNLARLGGMIDGETLKQADAFNDTLNDIEVTSKGVVAQISAGMLPTLNKLSKQLTDSVKTGDQWKQFGRGVGMILQGLAAAVAFLYGELRKLGTALAAVSAATASAVQGEFSGAWEIIKGLPSDLSEIEKQTRATVSGLLDFSEATTQAAAATEEWVETDDAAFEARERAAAALKALTTQTEKAGKAVKEVLNPMQQLIVDLAKLSEDKRTAQTQLEFLAQLPPELFKNLGLSLEEIAEAQERLKKSAGVWTVLDEGMKAVAENERAVKEMSEAWDQLVDKLSSGEITVEQFEKIAKALQKMAPAIDDANGAAQDMNDSMKELGEDITTAIGANANNAINDLIDSFGEAEVSFGDMVSAMLKDIAKLVVQLLIVKPLMDSIKGMFGGGATPSALGNAFAGATGLPHGIYNRPTFFPMPGNGPLKRFASGGVLGEAGPEAILPLKRNSAGELGVSGTGVQVNVYNNANVEVSTRESQSPDGNQVIDMIIDRRINERFGNGSMDKMMRANYGVGRAAGG